MKEKEEENKPQKTSGRRDFLKLGFLAGGAAVAGVGLNALAGNSETKGDTVKVMTTDGKLVEVDSNNIVEVDHHCGSMNAVTNEEARKGIPGKKFVMVIDLSRCKNARKCVKACQKMHYLPEDKDWLKVVRMQDAETTAPYWMPKPCFHCDHPPCVKVCPVDATFKREDGIVLVDNERCVGCRFCMAACPYSARSFNWDEPEMPLDVAKREYSAETSVPRKRGVVEKCDFCPDMLRDGKLPDCVTACPMGTIYFGNIYEDAVTNGDETVKFTDLMKDKAGYRYMEDLGTQPSVYYLPPASRQFAFKELEGETVESKH
jgi:molybdopterin-containing oxidoreductase family iron-sulfur binding subunit